MPGGKDAAPDWGPEALKSLFDRAGKHGLVFHDITNNEKIYWCVKKGCVMVEKYYSHYDRDYHFSTDGIGNIEDALNAFDVVITELCFLRKMVEDGGIDELTKYIETVESVRKEMNKYGILLEKYYGYWNIDK